MKKKFITFICLAAFLSAVSLILAEVEKKPLSIKEMIGIRSIGDVAVSPCGKMIAFEVSSVDWDNNTFTRDLWLAYADGSRCFPVTHGKDMNMSPAWSPDGKSIAFISTRLGKPQVFIFKPGFGEPELPFEVKNGVRKFAWSPDGKSVAFLTAEDLDEEKMKRQKQGFDAVEIDESPPRSQLYVYKLESKEIKPLVTEDFHIIGFSWAPDNSKLAFVTSLKNIEYVTWIDQKMRVVNSDGSGMKALDYKYYGFLSRHGTAVWSPDSRYLALEVGDLNKPELYNPIIQVYDFKTGKSFNASGDNDMYMQNCRWSKDGKYIYYVAYRLQNRQLFKLDFVKRKLEQISHFPKIDINSFSIADDGHTLVFSASTPSWPTELYVGDINNPDEAKRITNIHPDLENALICKTEEITWKAEDGLKLYGNIVYPAGYEKGKKYPTITLIHGGPAGNFNHSFNANFYCPAQYYAGQGYLVYLPNIRGSIGWGSEFMRKNIRDWGGMDYRDLMAGLDYLIERGLADEDKLVVWGGSYGGYMANWIVTQTDRFKAAHSEVSLANLYSMWALSPIGRVLSRLYFERGPQEDPGIYRKLSPVTYAKNVKTPLLLTQNEKDQRVAPEQALEFYRAVELTGTPVKLYMYPDEPHGTIKPIHQLDKLQKGTEWFAKYLK